MIQRVVLIFIAVMLLTPVNAVFAASTSVDSEFVQKPKKKKSKAQVKAVVFHAEIHCKNCVKKIEENVAFEKGVKDMKVSMENQTVELKYNSNATSVEKLQKAIEDLGYKVYSYNEIE